MKGEERGETNSRPLYDSSESETSRDPLTVAKALGEYLMMMNKVEKGKRSESCEQATSSTATTRESPAPKLNLPSLFSLLERK